MMVWLRRVGFVLALIFFAFTFLHASWLAPDPVGRPPLIAHQADPQIGTCESEPGTARQPVLPDNSLRAMTDVRQLGAAMIAVEIAPDGTLAPATCPGVYGGSPTLAQLVQTARPKRLLFTFSGDDPSAADRLAGELKAIGRDPVEAGDAFYATREAGPVARIRELFPQSWSFSAEGARACTADYRTQGWLGVVPESCERGTMMIPVDAQGSLPGWPNRLLARMKAADARVIVTGPETTEAEPRGLDLPEQFGMIPESFNGYIWVDDIWNLAPALFPASDHRTRAEQDAGEAAVKRRRAERQ